MKQLSGKKKIVFDMALNIVATAIPTFVLQLLILPPLAGHMSDERYGLLVTILSLLNIVPATLGNALNNIRLIEGKEKDSPQDARNYNAILSAASVISLVIVLGFSVWYERDVTPVSLLLTLLVSVLWLLREYHLVAFRLKLNYVYITISNVILVVGYVLGYLLFLRIGHWQLIYILGLAFSLVFIFIKSSLWKEPLRTDGELKRISLQTLLLAASGMLLRITTYADKMLIFPVLGGAMVSVYYASTLFGKIVSQVITPISGVILSYLSKAERKNDEVFRLAFLSSAAVCVLGYFACVAISQPILGWLYPQFVDGAMEYIWITTGTAVLTALISIINPFVLKFFDMKWQIAINGLYVAVYVGLSMTLLGSMGLYGFCVGTLLATALKLVFMLIVYYRSREKAAGRE